MMAKDMEDGVRPGYWCPLTSRWVTHERSSKVIDPIRTLTSEVSALEYLRTVSRATKQAGLTVAVSHIDTAINKLLNETETPKLRVLQILNNLHNAVETGDTHVKIPVSDLRLILQSPRLRV